MFMEILIYDISDINLFIWTLRIDIPVECLRVKRAYPFNRSFEVDLKNRNDLITCTWWKFCRLCLTFFIVWFNGIGGKPFIRCANSLQSPHVISCRSTVALMVNTFTPVLSQWLSFSVSVLLRLLKQQVYFVGIEFIKIWHLYSYKTRVLRHSQDTRLIDTVVLCA